VLDVESGLMQIGDGVLDEEFEFQLEPGTEYFLQVDSNGIYGDLGQYEVSVTWIVPEIEAIPEMPPIPFIPEGDPADQVQDIWSNPETEYVPQSVEPVDDSLVDYQPFQELALDDGVMNYHPEVFQSKNEDLVDSAPYQEGSSTVGEFAQVAPSQVASSAVYNPVSDAVFTQVDFSAFRSVSSYAFRF
jgi:hypothetical protein